MQDTSIVEVFFLIGLKERYEGKKCYYEHVL